MHLFYADPCLLANDQLASALCKDAVAICNRKGVATTVLAACPFNASALSVFSEVVQVADSDPITAWLSDYYAVAESMSEGLRQVSGMVERDVLVARISQPAHLGGLLRWLIGCSPVRTPTVTAVLDGGLDIDLVEENGQKAMCLPNPSDDPRPILYRFATRNLRLVPHKKFKLVSLHLEDQQSYALLLDLPVVHLPGIASVIDQALADSIAAAS